MKLRLLPLVLLVGFAACSGGGTSVPANQPKPVSQGLPANINVFGFGTTQTENALAPKSIAQVVIGSGPLCQLALAIGGVRNPKSVACDAVVFIPGGDTFASLPGFLYKSSALVNNTNYSLDLYAGVALCNAKGCIVNGPFTLLQANIGQALGFTAVGNTVSCNTLSACGANGFPFSASSPTSAYVVNLRPSA